MTAGYVYDALNAMTAIEENGATSGPGLLASFGYDGLGRLTGKATAGGAGLSTSYAYGDDGLLSSLTQTLAGGAGTTLGFTYSAAGQILTRSDSNGAYTAQPPAQSSAYAANGLNQVVSATGTSGGAAAAAGLAYDPLGRIAIVTQGGSTTSFLYAGWSLVGEYSSSGAILARYVPGAGTDAPAAMYTGPGTASRSWYAGDNQGSILALADASGNATLQLAYGPYGEPLTPSGASAWGESRYGYTGQIGIAGALAWFDKARIYDPAQGRFLQTDSEHPKRHTNLYTYVNDDPINATDPSGNWIVGGIIGAVFGGIDGYVTAQSAGPGGPNPWAAAAAGAVGGGIAGAVTDNPTLVGGAVAGAVDFVTQLSTGHGVNPTEVVASAALGAESGYLGGQIGSVAGALAAKAGPTLGKIITNAAVNIGLQPLNLVGGNLIGQLGQTGPALGSVAPSGLTFTTSLVVVTATGPTVTGVVQVQVVSAGDSGQVDLTTTLNLDSTQLQQLPMVEINPPINSGGGG